jgi:hypothetical protein
MKQHQNRLLSARPLLWTSPLSVKTGLKKVRPLKPVQPDHSLSSVLQRSSAVFETWRYLCEAGELGKVNPRYEFHYLGVAADVLHSHAEQVAQGIQGSRGTGESTTS